MNSTVVTIDGPGGSGKSTVARKVAKNLRFVHLNSGALFRALGVLAQENKVSLSDETALVKLACATRFDFSLEAATGETVFTVNGVDFSGRIGGEQVGDTASKIAVLPKLRQVFLELQREVAERKKPPSEGLVVEGRDSGSVVFPDATFKFYLDATPEERARRRLKEMHGDLGGGGQGSGEASASQMFSAVKAELEKRDERDRTRDVAPQVCPDGAQVIDTTRLTVEQAVEQVVQQIVAKIQS